MKSRKQLKLLLLQIRHHALVRQEELTSFAKYSKVAEDQIDILNVFDTPEFSPQIVDSYDAVFVGGASECPVTDEENYPFIKYAKNLLLYCIEINKPVFASCYGFQLVALALGSDIINVPKDFEMGTVPIKLTDNSVKDPLFQSMQNGFHAVSVHQDKIIETPNGCTLLAYTDDCIHAFRVDNKPFWCTQFHPEVDKSILIERLTVFKDKYTEGEGHLQNILSQAVETPESNALIGIFIDYVCDN